MIELAIVALIVLQLDTNGELAVGDLGSDADGVVGELGHVGLVAIGKEPSTWMNDATAGKHAEAIPL